MNKLLSYWNPFERIWLVVFCGMAVFVTIASGDNLFGFIVFLSGVLCVVLAAKGSIINYPAGMFNTIGYAWLAWQNGLYGEVGLNLLFYFPMNIVGFVMWRKHMDNGVVAMRKLPLKSIVLISSACIVFIAGLGFILSLLDGQNTPYIDAATNVLSVAATIMMIRRYREQWAAYIILNVLSVIMWLLRTAAGSAEGPLMAVMWSAYLVNAVYGLYNWTKGVEKAKEAEKVKGSGQAKGGVTA